MEGYSPSHRGPKADIPDLTVSAGEGDGINQRRRILSQDRTDVNQEFLVSGAGTSDVTVDGTGYRSQGLSE